MDILKSSVADPVHFFQYQIFFNLLHGIEVTTYSASVSDNFYVDPNPQIRIPKVRFRIRLIPIRMLFCSPQITPLFKTSVITVLKSTEIIRKYS